MNFAQAVSILLLTALACAVGGQQSQAGEPQLIASGDNTAGIELRLEATRPIRAGAGITIVTSTKRRGYLVLLMVEPSGEARQIFPLITGDLLPFGATIETNGIRPGKPVSIPDPANVLGNAELFAAGPGKAAVIALHSPVPVQIVGLTELPDTADVVAAVKNVFAMVKGLRILPRLEGGKPVVLNWSSAALIYDVE